MKKRYLVSFGSCGWDASGEECSTWDEVKVLAVQLLNSGYGVQVDDQRTGQHWTLAYRYDGLGIS
jgi:hypothetical protein